MLQNLPPSMVEDRHVDSTEVNRVLELGKILFSVLTEEETDSLILEFSKAAKTGNAGNS